MAGWHHRLDGHESEWTLGVGDGQEGLACCDSWGLKESDTTERLNWTEKYLGQIGVENMTYSVAVYSRFAMQYQSISEKFSVKTGSEYLLFDLASIPYHFLLLLHSGFLVGNPLPPPPSLPLTQTLHFNWSYLLRKFNNNAASSSAHTHKHTHTHTLPLIGLLAKYDIQWSTHTQDFWSQSQHLSDHSIIRNSPWLRFLSHCHILYLQRFYHSELILISMNYLEWFQ